MGLAHEQSTGWQIPNLSGALQRGKQFEFESGNGPVWVDSLSLLLVEISESAAPFPSFIKNGVCKDF